MRTRALASAMCLTLAGCGSCSDRGRAAPDGGPAVTVSAPSGASHTAHAPDASRLQPHRRALADLAPPGGCKGADPDVWVLSELAGKVSLHRFDVTAQTLTMMGDVPCAPRYIAVDRAGSMWGLSPAGKLFHVSLKDGSCTPTKLRSGQQGFSRFYMAFVYDGAKEVLYASDEHLDGDDPAPSLGLATIDTKTLALTKLGKFDNPDPENDEPCALAGTGDGRLYAVCTGAEVWRVGKAERGRVALESIVLAAHWMNPTRPRPVAFWGGALLSFNPACDVDPRDAHCAEKGSRVVSFSLVEHAATVLVEDLGVQVIAATSSTCAPLL
jgi:hypothetical protein